MNKGKEYRGRRKIGKGKEEEENEERGGRKGETNRLRREIRMETERGGRKESR